MQTAIISDYTRQLEELKRQVPSQAKQIVARLQDKIIPLIKERQLFERGIDGEGQRLKPYSPFTIALKRLKGEVFDRTTLLDTGDFYDGMFVDVIGEMLVFGSTDAKTPMLIEKYGQDIFTLTVDHNKIVNQEIILPELIKWLLENLRV